MKKIIVHKTKHGNIYYDASTKALEDKAFKKMFKFNDDYEYYYEYSLDEIANELEIEIEQLESIDLDSIPDYIRVKMAEDLNSIEFKKRQLSELNYNKELYLKAKKGNYNAIKRLLSNRVDCEYESWSIERVD